MKLDSLRVLIAGGGIAGLALAGALRRAGATVRVIERAPAWRPVGAGIVLQPNAIRALASLGTDISAAGHRQGGATLCDARGRVLTHTSFAAFEQEFGPALGVARPELHAALLASAADVPITLGHTVTKLVPDAWGVDVVTSDGETSRWDLVIGADGLRSSVRALLLGAADPGVRYSGYTCWRTIVPGVTADGACEMWGPGRRLGLVPLRDGAAYLFLVANAPPHAPGPDAAGVRAMFASFGGPAPAALAGLVPERLLHNDIEELTDIAWGGPRVWLLGDAAHALTPNMGQGAGLALEDAAEAMSVLSSAREVEGAFSRYVAARDARVRGVKDQSRRFGELAQWENGAARWVRDRLVSLVPASAANGTLRDLFSWQPGRMA